MPKDMHDYISDRSLIIVKNLNFLKNLNDFLKNANKEDIVNYIFIHYLINSISYFNNSNRMFKQVF